MGLVGTGVDAASQPAAMVVVAVIAAVWVQWTPNPDRVRRLIEGTATMALVAVAAVTAALDWGGPEPRALARSVVVTLELPDKALPIETLTKLTDKATAQREGVVVTVTKQRLAEAPTERAAGPPRGDESRVTPGGLSPSPPRQVGRASDEALPAMEAERQSTVVASSPAPSEPSAAQEAVAGVELLSKGGEDQPCSTCGNQQEEKKGDRSRDLVPVAVPAQPEQEGSTTEVVHIPVEASEPVTSEPPPGESPADPVPPLEDPSNLAGGPTSDNP